MNNLFESWRKFLSEEKGSDEFLSSQIIEKLVKDYASKPSELKFKYGDIREFIKLAPEDLETGGAGTASGFYVAKDNPNHPLYKTFVINTAANSGNLIEQFIVAIHEIQHFNQHMEWLNSELAGKISFIKNLASKYGVNSFPEDINFLESNTPIAELDREDKEYFENYPVQEKLFRWWENELGYNNAPHERDAKEFSFRNTQQALTKFLSQELIRSIIKKYGINKELVKYMQTKK